MPERDDVTGFEKLQAAAFRALCGEKEGRVTFKKGNYPDAVMNDKTLQVPCAFEELSAPQMGSIRGMVDAAALHLRYHDSELHADAMPEGAVKGHIFSAAEEARIESIGSIKMEGVARNLDARIVRRFLVKGYDHLEGVDVPPVDDILSLLIKRQLTGIKPPAITDKVMEKWGAAMQAKIVRHLKKLPAVMEDQAAFGKAVNTIIRELDSLGYFPQEAPRPEGEGESGEEESPPEKQSEQQEADSSLMPLLPAAEGGEEEKEASSTRPEQGEGDEDTVSEKAPEYMPNWQQQTEEEPLYKIYTTAFDQIVRAENLVDEQELDRLRRQLDGKLASLKEVTRRHANRFLRTLMTRQKRNWHFNLEEGVIDSSKLPLLIADPSYSEFYKQEHEGDQLDTVVTLLLDNSGSMRGRPITFAAICAEILAKTLESCGIRVEVLGFTTVEWKGGKSRQQWLANGAVQKPGRLNDLRHIIYKSADTPWRRSRKNLGLMLKEGILKENIDGEAILWAFSRLAVRPEKRRIMMVISDGAPVDDSTISTNNSAYLDNHLRQVIDVVESQSNVELVAIGIGHDVTRYYSHAVTIREVEELGDAMFGELTQLFDRRRAA